MGSELGYGPNEGGGNEVRLFTAEDAECAGQNHEALVNRVHLRSLTHC